MNSPATEFYPIIISSLCSMLGIVIGIALKYVFDFYMEKNKSIYNRKHIVYEMQLNFALEISYSITKIVKQSAFLISSIGSKNSYELYVDLCKSIAEFDDCLIKKMLLIDDDISNHSLTIACDITSLTNIIATNKQNYNLLEDFKKELNSKHSEIFDKKIRLDNILRKKYGIITVGNIS